MLDVRSFLSSERIDSSPQFKSEIEIRNVNSAGDLENSQICDVEESSDGSGIAVENSIQSRRLREMSTDEGKPDIGCGVGLVLKPGQRYKLLTEKWEPAEGFEFPFVEIAGTGKSRRFNGDWLIQDVWLAYSPSKMEAFDYLASYFIPL